MVKISAKLIKNHRTIKSVTYQNVNEYQPENFYFYLTEICRRLDVSMPLVVSYTRESYEDFNSVEFFANDFVEPVNFDCLFLENIDR